MARVEIKVKGLAELQGRLSRLAKENPVAAKRALVRQAEFVMTDSKQNYCPVKDGHLRASGHVVVDPKWIKVTWSYGGPAGTYLNKQDVGYAVVQHETLTFRHTVGQAEYLKRPLEKAIGSGMGDKIAREIATEFANVAREPGMGTKAAGADNWDVITDIRWRGWS